MTLIDVLVIVSLLLLGLFLAMHFTIFSGSLGPRELSPRTVCAANLKGIGTGFYTYAFENRDTFPIATHRPATKAGRTAVEYAPGAIGLNAERDSTERDDKVSTTRNFWYLVRDGASAPGSFICPSTNDEPSDIEDPLVCWDFGTTLTDCTAGVREAYGQVSYGYQVPYGLVGQPSDDRDRHMALAADHGPYSPALEIGAKHPDAPSAESNDPEDRVAWNSPNHDGDGQNVLFADSHAEFLTTPTVGVDDDNIYTRWTKPGDEDTGAANRMNGTPPTGSEAPFAETDSLVYP